MFGFFLAYPYYYFQKIKITTLLSENTYFFLKKNTPQKSILRQLKSKNIKIKYVDWRIVSLLHNDNFVPKAGEYLIPKNSTIYDIQNIFHNGETITRSFTLVEGTKASDLKEKLLSNEYLSGKVPILKEGIYKPDTYHFKYGFSRIKLLKRMKSAQNKILDDVWSSKNKAIKIKDKNKLLILASIIQSETSSFKDSQLVASVFINRLNKKMKLQSDVTLAYGLNLNGKHLTKDMLKSSHPFNTYFFKGLPPSPISYPGVNAMNALKYFKKTDYLYFVSDGNGGHRFTKNYSVHKKNIKLWKDNFVKDLK